MNKHLRKVLSVIIATSVAISTVSALGCISGCAADTAQVMSDSAVSGQVSTVYKKDGKMIFAVNKNGGNFMAEITTSGYADGTKLDAAVYAASADGEILLGETTEAAANGEISVDTDVSKLPPDAEKVVVKLAVSGAEATVISEIPVIDYELVVPEEQSADFWWVEGNTSGMHDPSIVKFDGDDTYYAYSSHHLIFTSKDLINWEKKDFTSKTASEMSPKSSAFILANYGDTTVKGTYWAPDVIYVEGDEKPYWMYISISCGLAARNSVISLVKSTSPLFWADADAEIEDMGVVVASKEVDINVETAYKTNAIDANIYTDADGNRYFIWGSFWGGIHGAKLTDEGFVEGIDYTSDETILSTSKTVGKALFTQRDGAVGPEGAWMIENEDTGYRYLFTSYGWLGSNYNTRVARSLLSTDFADVLASADGSDNAFVDANGVKLDTEYTAGSKAAPTGYKLIGSYRLGDGQQNAVRMSGDGNYYIPYAEGDAPIYYGPGHNSVLRNDNGEYYYVSHVRKLGVEGGAYLQVRKMLFTESGWPVVSPVTYTGEVEQKLPAELIPGTYELVAAGHTKSVGLVIGHKNNDVPLISSEITLLDDGTLADGLGTWEFDDDHTVTIKFEKNGDPGRDEFFKSGDVMTMKALLSYNRDTQNYVMALMGTDQNSVAQFAAKPMSEGKEIARLSTTPVTVDKSTGGNPELGFDSDGNVFYAGDPAALVDGDTVYIYVGHDTATDDVGYKMPEWACYSSKDMENWTYEGVVFKTTDIAWRNDDTSAWASQVAKYKDKYYLYYCTWAQAGETYNGYQCIGVAESDSPTGPFTPVGDTPLINGYKDTAESSISTSGWNDIDPTVWIETDENGIDHRYLGWGNGNFYVCELNEDMTSIKSGSIKAQGIGRSGTIAFTEGPWIYRRQDENGNYYGQYYVFYAEGWREAIGYAVADDLSSGNWIYKGQLMTPTATSNTNHPAVIDFNGKTYFIYHNGALPMGSGFRRSVAIQEIGFDKDGNVYPITEMSTGLTGTAVTLADKDGRYLAHEDFTNPSWDSAYPILKDVTVSDTTDGLNSAWEITKGLYEPDNESYVSIQAVNKPGLYIAEDGMGVVLTADADGCKASTMTFRTVKALDGSENGVSFESVSREGRFLTVSEGKVMLSYGEEPANCVFTVGDDFKASMSESYAADGVVSFKINDGAVFGDTVAYVAEYADGVLVGVSLEKVAITSDEQTINIEYTKKNEANMLKVFIWDGMVPVSDAIEVTVNTAPETGNTSIPAGYTSYYGFEDNLYDEVIGSYGALTGPFAVWYTGLSAEYEDGYNGKALSLMGADKYGVKLGKVISSSTYTVSFRFKANEFTVHTSLLFLDSDNVSAADAGGMTSNWVSMPIGQTNGTDAANKWNLKIWTRNTTGSTPGVDGNGFVTLSSNVSAEADKWYQVTVVAEGATGKMYVDGELVGSGTIGNVVHAGTTTYLGVNHWDTPFNGLVDDLYIYDGQALTAEQVQQLYTGTAKTAE